jgi:phosphonatase-like hydrolase
MIELVVFDIAGTAVRDDDAVAACLAAALAAAGVPASLPAINAVMGLPKPQALRQLIAADPAASEVLPRLDAIHADFVARMVQHYRSAPGIEAVDGAETVFAGLQRSGIRVALDTGFSRVITAALLERLGWRDGGGIDVSVCSDEVPRGRPHPDMIHAAMRRCGVADAARVAKVGDTPADLAEGTAAGCHLVVGVTSGTHTRAQLAPHPHTHLVDSIRDVPALCR